MEPLKLFAEPECWTYRDANPDAWASFACGPGDLGDYLVPDSILGVSVKECCRIHDWYYRLWNGSTEDDRAMADRILFNNMLRCIVCASDKKWITRLRSLIAHVYYRSVRKYGAPAFFEERNADAHYRAIDEGR